MTYMLDTDTCIHLINRRPGYEGILNRMSGRRYGEICASSITLAELCYGVAKSQQRSNNKDRLERFLARFEDRDFDQRAAEVYGEVRARLEAQGTPIGPLDALLAAHAMSLGATMVTNNIREFSRVAGLLVENWVGAPLA